MSNQINNGEVLYMEPCIRVVGHQIDAQYILTMSAFHPMSGWTYLDRRIFWLTADMRHDFILRQELALDWMVAEGVVAPPPESRPWSPPKKQERKSNRVPASTMERLLAWAKTL